VSRRIITLGAVAIGIRTAALLATGFAVLASAASGQAQQGTALILPKHNEAIPGKRIGWYFDDISPALKQANGDGRPVVIVLVADPCGWCRIFLAHVLRCNGFNALAGQAHFAIITETTGVNDSSTRDDLAQFRRLLKVESYPAIAMISVKNGTITPVAKITGAGSEASILASFSKAGLAVSTNSINGGQNAAIGLPMPSACGATAPEATLAPFSPQRVQKGIAGHN
jgi:hypothetical protein